MICGLLAAPGIDPSGAVPVARISVLPVVAGALTTLPLLADVPVAGAVTTLPLLADVAGALTTLPLLEDVPVDEVVGVDLWAQLQINTVNAITVKVLFICLLVFCFKEL
jgi:hypothetical protein